MSLQERCEWVVYIAYSVRTDDIQNGLANKIIEKWKREKLQGEVWRLNEGLEEHVTEEERKTYGGDLPFEVKGRSW